MKSNRIMSLVWYLTKLISKPRPLIPLEDRLSDLPDSILCHILSFLPTKRSAATTILSKRWNSLWLSVLTLDLFAKKLSDSETFDRVILLRDIKVPIQTLRLKFNVMVSVYDDQELFKYSLNHIDSLVGAATRRGLETLELDTQLTPIGLHLGSTIFSYKTLTVLKLRHLTILNEHLNGINTSLKTLHLDHVYFRCHRHILNFLSSFPTLEELKINNVLVVNFTPENLLIKWLPNLMRASISDCETIPLFLLSRALILSIKLTSTHLMTHYHVYRLTHIELFFKLDSKKKREWMLEMLQHSPNLQHLIINEKMENGNGEDNWQFNNGLQKMENDDCEDNWQDPVIIPECLSSHLKTCLIDDYGGRKCEFQFAEYIMRNSKVLRNMTIHSSRSINLKAKFLVLQKLSQCPRNCKLIFD